MESQQRYAIHYDNDASQERSPCPAGGRQGTNLVVGKKVRQDCRYEEVVVVPGVTCSCCVVLLQVIAQ